jgi:hypothetical protein
VHKTENQMKFHDTLYIVRVYKNSDVYISAGGLQCACASLVVVLSGAQHKKHGANATAN